MAWETCLMVYSVKEAMKMMTNKKMNKMKALWFQTIINNNNKNKINKIIKLMMILMMMNDDLEKKKKL